MLVALHAAIAQAQYLGVAVAIAQHLYFDVAQRRDESFQIDVAAAEGALRFQRNAMERFVEVIRFFHHGNAFAAAAVNRLDEHRIADVRGRFGGAVAVGENAVAAGHHRYAVRQRCGNGIGFVAHRFHAGHQRADEINFVGAHQFRELGVFRKKANAGMQGVHLFVLGNADDGACVQIAFVRRVAANADQRIGVAKHVRGNGFHVWVRLHQHHRNAVFLGDADELDGRAAAGVNEHFPNGPKQRPFRHFAPRRFDGGPFVFKYAGENAIDHVVDGLLRHGNGTVDLAEFVVELRRKGMLHKRSHRSRHFGKIVGQVRIGGQIAGNHDLPGERHAGTGEIAGMCQRMGDETRLGAAGAVAVAKDDHGQIEVAHEAGDSIIHRRH